MEVYKGMREPPLLLGPPVPSSKEPSPGPEVRNAAAAEGAQNHAQERDGVDSLTELQLPSLQSCACPQTGSRALLSLHEEWPH